MAVHSDSAAKKEFVLMSLSYRALKTLLQATRGAMTLNVSRTQTVLVESVIATFALITILSHVAAIRRGVNDVMESSAAATMIVRAISALTPYVHHRIVCTSPLYFSFPYQ